MPVFEQKIFAEPLKKNGVKTKSLAAQGPVDPYSTILLVGGRGNDRRLDCQTVTAGMAATN
jgi:hypothetical protein